MTALPSLQFTTEFVEVLSGRTFNNREKSQFVKALRLLDENERHPSLRVHALAGDLEGQWSASASRSLRITFQRLPDGRKLLITCSRHYDR